MARTARENVREKILEAAETRLWRHGIKKTTIDEIAADAGVGKGTVYLYFDSKEDISLAIFAEYKIKILSEQETIARDGSRDTVAKIREILTLPAVAAYTRCSERPEAMELISVLKPHLAQRMRPFVEQETALLAQVLEEGNLRGILNVSDTLRTARTLKLMTAGFFPPFPILPSDSEITRDIECIVELAVRGMRKCP